MSFQDASIACVSAGMPNVRMLMKTSSRIVLTANVVAFANTL